MVQVVSFRLKGEISLSGRSKFLAIARNDKINCLCLARWEREAEFISVILQKALKNNPFDSIQRFAEAKNERAVSTMEDFWKVFNVAKDGQDKLMLLALLHTGPLRFLRLCCRVMGSVFVQ